jgi:hypothetical protein
MTKAPKRTSGNFGHPLDGPIYVGRPDPKECKTCGKKGQHMTLIARDLIECSHIDCPHRNRVTAQPSKP